MNETKKLYCFKVFHSMDDADAFETYLVSKNVGYIRRVNWSKKLIWFRFPRIK